MPGQPPTIPGLLIASLPNYWGVRTHRREMAAACAARLARPGRVERADPRVKAGGRHPGGPAGRRRDNHRQRLHAAALVLLLSATRASAAVVSARTHATLRARPAEALSTFWAHTWLRGGALALPLVFLDAYGDVHTRHGSTRTLWPFGLRERVEGVRVSADGSEASVRYAVVESGWCFGGEDIRHSGEVRFVSSARGSDDGCELEWAVAFAPPHGCGVERWQRITEAALGATVADLRRHIESRAPEVEVVFRRTLAASAPDAWHAWRTQLWQRGGGLPLPPPVDLGGGTRLVLPPGLLERVLVSDRPTLRHVYTVLNPGVLSLYPVSEHEGVVAFRDMEHPRAAAWTAARGRGELAPQCELIWSVRLRPLRCDARVGFARLLTNLIVGALVRGFRVDGAGLNGDL